jgi:hypothetical protein
MAERKRATGFVLMDAAFTADAKFVRLARMVPDPHEYAACIGVFWLLLADCRRAKDPAVDWDDYPDYQPQVDLLRAARLLNDTGFEPEPFKRWAPAYKAPGERLGTGGYGGLRKGTEGTNTSGQVKSVQVDSEQGLWGGSALHDGHHGETCVVCYPPSEQKVRVVK